jgi:hypothetical protein
METVLDEICSASRERLTRSLLGAAARPNGDGSRKGTG